MTIKEVQDLIVEEFSAFDEWMDKYEYIIELGKSLEMIDTGKKVEEAYKRLPVKGLAGLPD